MEHSQRTTSVLLGLFSRVAVGAVATVLVILLWPLSGTLAGTVLMGIGYFSQGRSAAVRWSLGLVGLLLLVVCGYNAADLIIGHSELS